MNSGSWFWPDVSDLDGAKDGTKYGMWCAILVAGFTALFVVLSFLGIRVLAINASALVDAALFAAIAYGISKYSRFAAVAGFLLYLLEKIYALMTTGSILGVGVLGVVILFGFLNGIRGAFAYHRLSSAAGTQTAIPPAV